MSDILITKKATPSIPSTNKVKIYVNTSGNIESIDDAGLVKTYSTGITSEQVQDIVGSMIVDTSTIDVTYDDAGNTLSMSVIQTALDHVNLQNKGTNTHAQIDSHISSTGNPHSVTKTQVGLGNVDNTSDINKPISTATQVALNAKYDSSNPNNYETPTQLNARDTANRTRGNHTGTQLSSTISDFLTAVLGSVLTGISFATNSAVLATDSVLDALGKIQAQLNGHFGSGGSSHLDATTSTSGFMSGTDKVKLDGITNDIFYKTVTQLTNSSNVTLTNITELSIPVVAGNSYRFRIWIIYRSSNATTGLVVAMTTSGVAAGTLSANLRNNTSTTAASLSTLNAFNTVLVYTATPTANTDYIAEVEGIFVCTTSGNILPQFRSETNGQTITVQINSIAEVKQL